MLNETAIEQVIANAWAVRDHFQHKIVGASPGWLDDIIEALSSVVRSIGDTITDKLNRIVSPIETLAQNIWRSLSDLVNGIGERLDALKDRIMQGIGAKVDSILASVSSTYNNVKTYLSDVVTSVWDNAKEFLRGIRDGVGALVAKAQSFAQDVGDKVGSFVSNAVSSVWSAAKEVWEKVTGALSTIGGKVWESAESLGEKIKGAIASLLAKVKEALDKIQDAIAKAIADALKWSQDNILKPLAATFQNAKEHLVFKEQVLLKASLGQYTSFDDFAADISDPIPVLGALGAVLGTLLIGVVVAPGISAALSPAFENLTHLTSHKFQSARLLPHDAIQAYFKGAFHEEKVYSELLDQGLHKSRVNALIEAMRPVPNVDALQEAKWRNILPEGKVRNKLRSMGYCEDDVNLFIGLMDRIPPLSDIIRMAVREAFTPDVAQKFGQYEDYPTVLTEYARKQGLSEDWAKRYWAAHWDLPSPTMGFEMYHRGIITRDELKMLLRALDVMPYWREKLIDLSTSLPTRVDIRRLYATGIYTEQQVKEAYRKLGYSESDATALTRYTVENYAPEEETEKDRQKKLTSGIILSALQRGFIDETEAKANLVELGYTPDNADFMVSYTLAKDSLEDVERTFSTAKTLGKNTILQMYRQFTVSGETAHKLLLDMGYSQDETDTMLATVDLQREFERRQAYLDTVKDVYINGAVSKVNAIAMLSEIKLTAEEQQYLLNTWDNEKARRVRHATEAQYRAAVKAKLITIDDYKRLLANIGYTDFDVELLAQLLQKGG